MMKKLLAMLLVIVTVSAATGCGKSETRYTFKYQSKSYDYTTDMYYDDSLFDDVSTVYNPSLATASLSFAMASFASMDEKDYQKKSCNASDLLNKLGFNDIKTNSFFKEKPTSDSLGCIFGHKDIGGRRMIACSIRGANYGAEWASNITVGTNQKYHQGFYEGSTIFLDSLKQYLSDLGIQGELSLWITGYSRAGAVINISAGRIDEAIQNNEKILGDGIILRKDNIYVYCFEPPQGVCYDESLYPKSELFNNIFCIVNHNDIVTKTAMKEFSFTRYGIEKVLFNPLNDPQYNDDIQEVIKIFGSYENSEILGEYLVDSFEMKRIGKSGIQSNENYCNWTQGLVLDELLSRLTVYGLKDRENYESSIQPGLRDILTFLFSADNTSASLIDLGLSIVRNLLLSNSFDLLFDDLLHNPSKLKTDFRIVLEKALEALEIDADVTSVEQSADALIGAVTAALIRKNGFNLILPFCSASGILAVGQAHQPELTLAFMRSLDPEYTSDPVSYPLDGMYYCIEIEDDSADVSVVCDDNEIVKFEKGKPVETGSSVPYANQDKLLIYLPYHSAYTITSSSDKVSVKVYEPALIGYRDIQPEITSSDGAYNIIIHEM